MKPLRMIPPKTLIVPLLVLGLLGDARRGLADAGPMLPQRALYLLPGITLGGTSSLDVGTGFTLGGEVSVARWLEGFYYGAAFDALYDWKRESGRMVFGAEIGWGPIGLDGGYLLEIAKGGPYSGAAVRAYLHIGIMAFYVRYVGIFERPDAIEWGVMIKVPIPFFAHYRQRRPYRHHRPSTAPTTTAPTTTAPTTTAPATTAPTTTAPTTTAPTTTAPTQT